MSENAERFRLLIIEDEGEWQREIASILKRHCPCDIVVLSDYREADVFVTSCQLDSFDAAVIDVKLRKQIYDQGGLAILDLLKERRRDIPVLMLTAYSYDYPGLTDVTKRYIRVLTYDKDVFVSQPDKILNILLADLPPEIDASEAKRARHRFLKEPHSGEDMEGHGPLREIWIGAIVVGFILTAVVLFLLISNRFPNYAVQLNVVFGLLVVALICVLLRVFRPDFVSQAVRLYKDFILSGKPSTHPDGVTKGKPDKSDKNTESDT